MILINLLTLLLLFSNEVLVILSLILKMLVSIASNEGPNQTALMLANYRHFWQMIGVRNLDQLLYVYSVNPFRLLEYP